MLRFRRLVCRENSLGARSFWNLRMASLPDELWTKILGMGVEKQVLDYRDLCSLAFVCRRIRRISSLECMWRPLWERDQAELGGGTSTRNSVSEARKDNEIKSFRDLYRIRLISLFWCFDDRMPLSKYRGNLHCSIRLSDVPCRRPLQVLRLLHLRCTQEVCAKLGDKGNLLDDFMVYEHIVYVKVSGIGCVFQMFKGRNLWKFWLRILWNPVKDSISSSHHTEMQFSLDVRNNLRNHIGGW